MKKRLISLFAVAMMFTTSMLSVAASNGETAVEDSHNHELSGATQVWTINGDIDNPRVGDIFEDENGERTRVIRIENDGTIVADVLGEGISTFAACTHPASSLQAMGGLPIIQYSKYSNNATKCYKTRNKYLNTCTACHATNVPTYSAWSSDKAHSFSIFTGKCTNKADGTNACGYKK